MTATARDATDATSVAGMLEHDRDSPRLATDRRWPTSPPRRSGIRTTYTRSSSSILIALPRRTL